MWLNDPNWQMTGLFLLALAVMGFVMKLVVALLPVTIKVDRPYTFWLLLSPASHRRLRPKVIDCAGIRRITLLYGTLFLSYWIYGQLLNDASIPKVVISYCGAPLLLLATESLLSFVTLLWLPSGQMLPVLHNRPWLARSIADFWGSRWNLWFSDWSRYAIFQRLRRRPVFATILAFTVSGVLHEWVINVPLYFVTGRALFGTMILYFLIQAIGMLIERRLKGHPVMMLIFAWFVICAPIPLVINEGLLRTMHLWPENHE